MNVKKKSREQITVSPDLHLFMNQVSVHFSSYLVTRPNVPVVPKVATCYYHFTKQFTSALCQATSKQPASQVNLYLKLQSLP